MPSASHRLREADYRVTECAPASPSPIRPRVRLSAPAPRTRRCAPAALSEPPVTGRVLNEGSLPPVRLSPAQAAHPGQGTPGLYSEDQRKTASSAEERCWS